jgi:hypothetical protein
LSFSFSEIGNALDNISLRAKPLPLTIFRYLPGFTIMAIPVGIRYAGGLQHLLNRGNSTTNKFRNDREGLIERVNHISSAAKAKDF